MTQLRYGLAITALVLWVGHWLPWPKPLHRLVAYAYGVAAIYLGIYIWLGWGVTFQMLCLFPLAGGAATGLAYFYDFLRNKCVKASLYDGD